MTYQQIYEALRTTGYPVAFNFFEIGEVPELPYIVFTYPDNDDFLADNTNYAEVVQLNVELYAKRKNILAEKETEAVLRSLLGPYTKTSQWLDTEGMQMTTYELEVLVNEEETNG